LPVSAAYVVADRKLNLDIAIVDIDSLHVHEEIVPELLDQLTRSIRLSGHVKHPIIVDKESLVVLDGVHRVAALRRLGISRVPACMVDYNDPAIEVLSWYRSIVGVSNPQELALQVEKAGCSARQTGEFDRKKLGASPAVAILKLPSQTFSINCTFTNLSEAFDLVGQIEEQLRAAGFTVRYETEHDALQSLKEGRVDAVLCTPEITKEEIIKSALSGRVLAWKATRHVIPARPLNVNVPLSLLRSKNKSLNEVNLELKRLLRGKRIKRLPSGSVVEGRRYEEELYVFEE